MHDVKLEQSVGTIAMVAFTGGAPITTKLTIGDRFNNIETRLSLNDLYDLRYAASRMIEQIEADQREQDRLRRSYR